MLDQGETARIGGILIVTAGWVGAIGGLVGAGLAPFRPAWGQMAAVVGLLGTAPLSLFTTFPRLWCSVMLCQAWDRPFRVEILGLYPLALIAVAVVCLGRPART